MPVAVFCVGVSFGTEKFNWPVFSNMLVVSVGVCIASYGAHARDKVGAEGGRSANHIPQRPRYAGG